MEPFHQARLIIADDDLRCRVLERAAIIQEATGCTWAMADKLSWDEETKQR